MSGLVEHVERAENARWEAILVEDVPCDISEHGGEGVQSLFHSGAAAYATMSPCGMRHTVCKAFRDAVWYIGKTHCRRCGENHAFLDISWIEL